MDIGTELKRAREQQGYTLSRLADLTKISVSSLRAIENQEWSKLPGGIFTRAFVKAYAKEVGLDPLEALRRFVEETEGTTEDVGAAESGTRDEAANEYVLPSLRQVFTPWRMVVAALVLVSAYLFFRQSEIPTEPETPFSRSSKTDVSVGTAATGNVDVPLAGTATSGTPDPIGARSSAEFPLRVDFHPRGTRRVTATTDGVQVMYQLTDVGERHAIQAQDRITLRLGDAAACAFSINGAAARPLGGSGQALSLTITVDNYRSFVSP